MPSTPGSASVVAVGAKQCTPFAINVMVYAPESGYKAEVSIERACTATNDSIWKFVFDLYKKQATGTGFDQLVHVSYQGLNAQENAAIAGMVDGLSDTQADRLSDLNTASQAFHNNQTPANQTAVVNAAQAVVNA
jgi:hypothetical protein